MENYFKTQPSAYTADRIKRISRSMNTMESTQTMPEIVS